MKGLTTLLLLVLVAALGSFIYFFEMENHSTAESNALARKAFRFNPDQVQAVMIETDGLILSCEKNHNQWSILDPVSDMADRAAIRRFLHYLELMRKNTTITEAERKKRSLTLADYGLDPPQTTITLDCGNKVKVYLVGRTSSLGQQVYVMEQSSDAIIPVDAQLLNLIPASPSAWRSHNLFQESVVKIAQLSMKRAEGFVQFAKQENGQWELLQPVKARTAQSSMQQLLDVLSVLHIDEFVSDAPETPTAYGLDQNPLELSIRYQGQENSSTLLIGDELESMPGSVYAKWTDKDFVYAVSNVMVEIMNLPLDDFRDRRLMTQPALAIKSVALQKNDQTLELQREKLTFWTMVRPYRQRVDAALMDTFADRWCEARIDVFVADNVTNWSDYGLSEPRAHLYFTTQPRLPDDLNNAAASDAITEILVSADPPVNDLILIQEVGTPSVYAVTDQLLRTLVMNPLFYRNREILNLYPENILRITIEKNGTKQVLVRETDQPSFTVIEPHAGALDSRALETFLGILAPLRATCYISKDSDDLSEFGLLSPAASVTLGLTGTEGIAKTLLFGKTNGEEGVYTMIRGQDIIFELDQAQVDLLTTRLTPQMLPEGEAVEQKGK